MKESKIPVNYTQNDRLLRRLTSVFLLVSVMAVVGALRVPLLGAAMVSGLIFCFLSSWTPTRTAGSYLRVAVGAVGMGFALNSLSPYHNGDFFLLPTAVYAPTFIFLAIGFAFFTPDALNLTVVLGASYLATLLAGGLIRGPAWFPLFYGVIVVIQLFVLLALLARLRRRLEQTYAHNGRTPARRTIYWGSLILAALITWASSQSMFAAYQSLFQEVLGRMTFRSAGFMVRRDADIRTSLPKDAGKAGEIVLRVRAEKSPGYLRGFVMDHYESGRWKVLDNRTEIEFMPHLQQGKRGMKIFSFVVQESVRAASTNDTVMTVYPTPDLYTDVLLTPGSVREVALPVELIKMTEHGVLHSDSGLIRVAYEAKGSAGGEMAWAFPASPGNDVLLACLQIPELVRSPLESLARQVFSVNTVAVPTKNRIEEVRTWLWSNCSYALGVKLPERIDPVLGFVSGTHRGHCELFASAAALLLRAEGVPTRYVTGFLCGERHPFGSYWVARTSTAHAWVEAYVKEEQRWVLVEATPPDGLPGTRSHFSAWSAFFDQMAYLRQLIAAGINGPDAGDIFRNMLACAYGKAVRVLSKPWVLISLGVAIICVSVILAALRYRRRTTGGLRVELQVALRYLEKMSLRMGVRRRPVWTIGEWGASVAQVSVSGEADLFLQLLGEYEKLRYEETSISVQDCSSLVNKLRSASRSRSGSGEIGDVLCKRLTGKIQ